MGLTTHTHLSQYFRIERNKFVERAFAVLDFDTNRREGEEEQEKVKAGDGQLNYTEFFISL